MAHSSIHHRDSLWLTQIHLLHAGKASVSQASFGAREVGGNARSMYVTLAWSNWKQQVSTMIRYDDHIADHALKKRMHE